MSPFTSRRSASVAALGETGLISAIQRWLGSAAPPPPFGMGDDCAVVAGSRGRQLLKVDPVIYSRHFDDSVPARAAGAKLLKRNLSDIAAMGGRPVAAVVALFLDPGVRLAWLEEFHRGLADCARRHGVSIVGGAVGQAKGVLSASLTLLGRAPPRLLGRRGARVGDRIYVTGVLGCSLASGHHLTFRPRLREGAWCARNPAVKAMMDISDGLAKDLPAITPANAEAAIEARLLPLRPGADLRAGLSDGEDYELLLAVDRRREPAAFAAAWRRAFPRTRLTRIGTFARARPRPARGGAAGGLSRLRTPAPMILAERLRRGVTTRSAEATRRLAAALAGQIPIDATLALGGDLGVGKTTFVQGLARGFGISAPVASPTFTIYSLHRGDRLLVHLDAYRIERPEQVDALMLDDFLTTPYCLAVEWPDRIADWLPPDAWRIDLGIAAQGSHTIRLR